MNEIVINNLDGQLTVSSLQIANDFGKQHKHILDAIENLKAENSALTKMFIETTYTAGTGKHYKRYDITRDGFSLLVMGFTGKKALEWKLKYIEAFNLMEDKLRNSLNGINLEEVITKAVTTAVSETIKALMPLVTSPQTSEKRVAIICKPKVRYKIDLLPADIRNQVDDMLCSGRYTAKEVSKYIQEQTGLYISYVTLCNYKKTHFILVEDDMQLTP